MAEATQEQVTDAIIRALRDPCSSGTQSQLIMLGDAGLRRAEEMVGNLMADINCAQGAHAMRATS